MRKKPKFIDDWTDRKSFCKEIKRKETSVKYFTRKPTRTETGFEVCMRQISPRVFIYSPSRYWWWVDNDCKVSGAA